MSLDFVAPAAAGEAIARSPMESVMRAAGARFEVRDGWNVAVAFSADTPGEAAAAARTAGWADLSHVSKLELQGACEALDQAAGTELAFGTAALRGDAWWCRLTQTRALAVGASAAPPARRRGSVPRVDGTSVVDVTTSYAALALVGPLAREVLARFCALDLRPAMAPVGALRPGSIGRQPGILIREAEDRFLILFGWATGEYMWSLVTDAGRHLGGAPIGVDALAALAGAAPLGEAVGA